MKTDLVGISSDLIGFSEEARPIRVFYAGDEPAPLRILIMAGQHGDERRGREAVRRFAHVGPAEADPSVPVGLALVPEVNPDGAARRTRTNAHGVDVNRDHLRLAGAETRALHRFVRTWRPDLIVDVHDFPPRRRHLLTRQLVYCHDVFLDVPTHPSAHHPALGGEGSRLLQPIVSALSAAGYRAARYTRVTRSGRVRHSTPDVVDARNGLALRYGIPTILVEGRGSSRSDDPAVEAHVLAGMEHALAWIVRWAQENYAALTGARPGPLADEPVPVRTRYRRAARPCTLAFANARSGRIDTVELPGRFTPQLEADWAVTLPRAYAVPCTQGALLQVLRRQAFALVPAAPDRLERIERYWVEELKPARRPNRAPRDLKLSVRTEQRPLNDHVLIPVTEDGGPALAVLLEPASKHGLARFADLRMPVTSRSAYPVLRVL
jgi:predicted deacylase